MCSTMSSGTAHNLKKTRVRDGQAACDSDADDVKEMDNITFTNAANKNMIQGKDSGEFDWQ